MIGKWFVRKLRKPKTPVALMICLFGFLLILSSKGAGWLSGVGISILASGIISVVSMFFLYDEDELRPVKEWGLVRVYATRGEMNSSCDEYLARTKTLKAIGFGFKSLRDSQEGSILRILHRGGSVQLITMDPDCEILKEREEEERQEISSSIRDLVEWANELNNQGLPGKVEIRFHRRIPPDFLFILSNRLYTGPYEYGKTSQQTLSFEYSVTGRAYEYYEKRFDKLWNDSTFCKS